MCDLSGIVFGAKNLSDKEIEGKDILEAGAYDVNGSLRPVLEAKKPKSYVGVDIAMGPGVDIVCPAENMVEHFGEKKFDVVVSTEMLEHVRDWQAVIHNLKNMVKPGGILLVTTRSYGFHYHAYPYDFWRYEKEDMEKIFADFEIITIEKDWIKPGIFVKARRPLEFKEVDLSHYKLYSIVTNTKITHITDADFDNKYFKKLMLREKLNKSADKMSASIRSAIRLLIGWNKW